MTLPDGRLIYVDCRGRGSPTVVLESGIHDSSDVWSLTRTEPPVPASPATLPGIARGARVCTYDRPGTIRYTTPPTLTGRSSPVAMPRSLPALVSELDQTLTAAGEKGPYLLVGHSFGGMITRLYAQTHPERTAGLVFVDAFGPEIRDGLGADWPAYARLVNRPGVPLERDPGFETIDLDGAMAAVEKGPRLPSVPMAVISKTAPFEVAPGTPTALMKAVEAAWPRLQDSLVALGPHTPHVLATGSDHYVQLRDPDLVTSTVGLVLNRARDLRTAPPGETPTHGPAAR
ncbi:alpha/beta fold hydrolase [Streptomyces sp. NPDC058746]|uniref:alpha/beta fold hydrolase n=1 Tax=Streptomyces sp. NPDC058746 TaxID=3346622 RepID=UPI0036B4E753